MTGPLNPSPGGSFLEGLTGGAERMYTLRRQTRIEDEQLTMQRARELRAAVGAELQQRVYQAQLEDRDTARADRLNRQQHVAAAAEQIKRQYGNDPRFKGITMLPAEDMVREFGDLITHPERFEKPDGSNTDLLYNEPGQPVGLIDRGTGTMRPVTSGGRPVVRPAQTPAGARADERQDLTTVEHQVDDTRADLARAEREMPTRPTLADQLPAVAQRFTADSSAAAGRVDVLRQRADSLGVVRDSIAAAIQGRSFRRPGAGAAPSNPQLNRGPHAGARAPNDSTARARARAVELQGQGKSREEILRIMRTEGYNVE